MSCINHTGGPIGDQAAAAAAASGWCSLQKGRKAALQADSACSWVQVRVTLCDP